MISIHSTTTTENPTPNHLVFVLSSAQSLEEKFIAVHSNLREIRSRYLGENDKLSTSLREWIDRFSACMREERPACFDELIRLAKREFDLLQEMFRNPFSRDRHVETSFFDGEFIWDEATLKDYLQLSHISPFDGTSCLEAHPHPFCSEMIAWWKSLPLDPLYRMQPTHSLDLIVRKFSITTPPTSTIQSISSQNANTKLELYILYAQQAISTKKIHNQQKAIEKLSVAIRTTAVRAKEEIGEVVTLMRQSNEAHRVETDMRLTALEETQQTTRNIFTATIRDKDQKINHLDQQQKLSEKEIGELKRQAALLQSQIASQANTIAALSNRVNSDDGGSDCTIL
jgi:hypothetical protein